MDQPEQEEVLDNSTSAGTPAVAEDVLPETLYIMPVPNRPFFPGQVQPVSIDTQEWAATLKGVGEAAHGLIGLA